MLFDDCDAATNVVIASCSSPLISCEPPAFLSEILKPFEDIISVFGVASGFLSKLPNFFHSDVTATSAVGQIFD